MTNTSLLNSTNKQDHHFDVSNSEDDENQMKPVSARNSINRPSVKRINDVQTLENNELNELYDEWLAFDGELRAFEVKHKEYVNKLDEVELLKTKHRLEIDKYKKKTIYLKKGVEKLRKAYVNKGGELKDLAEIPNQPNLKNSHSSTALSAAKHSSISDHSSVHLRPLTAVNSSPELNKLVDTLTYAERLNLIISQLDANELYLSRISYTLPRKDSYLKVILGGVDVSILNKADKWKYKQEYENFKFIVTCISLVSSIVIWSLTSNYRAFDALFHFLLVWYYCTLTIRESILIVNGSHIHPWWRAHHFVATVATAILLTWPESVSYRAFRTKFFSFSLYLSFIQGFQFYYQRGCLYRLRALGESNDMDVIIEGFHRWMFRGLSFLVPFLLIGYLFQLYIAYFLWRLAHLPTTNEWQVYTLAIIFFLLFLGNIITTLSVLRDKLREETRPILLKEKYQSLKAFLSTNYHRRRRSFTQLRRQH